MIGSISFQLIDGKLLETKSEYTKLPRGTPLLPISNIVNEERG